MSTNEVDLATAFDMGLRAVAAGIEGVIQGHRDAGNRQIVAAMSPLPQAIRETSNPFAATRPPSRRDDHRQTADELGEG